MLLDDSVANYSHLCTRESTPAILTRLCWPPLRYATPLCYWSEIFHKGSCYPIPYPGRCFRILPIQLPGAASHYPKPRNFSLADNQIFWEELPASWNGVGYLGTSQYVPLSRIDINLAYLGAFLTGRMLIHFVTLISGFPTGRKQIFCSFACLTYTLQLCQIVNIASLFDSECSWPPFERSAYNFVGWPTGLLFGHVRLSGKINSLRTQMLGY
jgi:hypothetical protein